MNNKITTLILSAALCLSMAACGESSSAAAVPETTGTDIVAETAACVTDTSGNDLFKTVAVAVTLADGASSANGEGVSFDGDVVTITSGGSYVITGALTDGQLVVDTGDDSDVLLTLYNLDITNSDAAAINIAMAGDVCINLEANTENQLTVAGENNQTALSAIDAAICSTSDLFYSGTGTLTVDADGFEVLNLQLQS